MTSPPSPCSSAAARQFDFWLGEWHLTWPAEQTGGESGETATGTNRVERLFGDCAIEERFSTNDHKFQGRSLSVHDEEAGRWRQTWVDSSGGYLAFSGGLEDDEMVLTTATVEHDGEILVNRMVFSAITADSLTWHWQGSRDGGQSWNELWTISYTRRA